MAVPMAGYVLTFAFPLYINILKGDSMDLHRATGFNIDQAHAITVKEIQLEENPKIGVDGKGAIETVERGRSRLDL